MRKSNERSSLLLQALIKFTLGLLLVASLLFLPAGSLSYRQAWLLLAILFIPMFAAGLVMLRKSPALLKKRLNAKEKLGDQKSVILLSALLFLAVFLSAGLCWRLDFLILPYWVSLAATVLFLLAYALYAEVLRENAYLSRTIEIQQGQQLVDTGLYGLVRHPMYAGTVLLFLSMPLVLGSLLSFLLMLGYVPLIVLRIRGEEKLLREELPGYADYMERVKYRLIPYLW